jgi:RNA polymerase sigma factor (TIGR02999 family)
MAAASATRFPLISASSGRLSDEAKRKLQRSGDLFFRQTDRGKILMILTVVTESDATAEVTQLLRAWANGDSSVLERLTPLVYDELRRMARRYMRKERAGHTLQTTALLHEAFLRLVGVTDVMWQDRVHFFAVSAQMMRRILVDAARARVRSKRGGHAVRGVLDEVPDFSSHRDREIVAINDALKTLAAMDPRKARVVELRFFGGLSVEETAAILKISPQSVMRDWKLAKAWLMRELER